MRERRDERICREAFTQYMRGEGKWSKGGEPPDYNYEFRGIVYAVEATSAVESGVLAAQDSLPKILRAVEAMTLAEGTLLRNFGVKTGRGLFHLDRKDRKALGRAIAEAVRRDEDFHTFTVGQQRVTLEARDGTPAIKFLLATRSYWAAEHAQALIAEINARIADKRRKAPNMVAESKILLILDAFHVFPEDLPAVVAGANRAPEFCAIYLVRQNPALDVVSLQGEIRPEDLCSP